jgi:hypothetical protein
VYLLDPKNGKVVWKQALGAGTFAAATAHPDGRFYCMSNFGNLYAFEVKKNPNRKIQPAALRVPSAFFRPQMQ